MALSPHGALPHGGHRDSDLSPAGHRLLSSPHCLPARRAAAHRTHAAVTGLEMHSYSGRRFNAVIWPAVGIEIQAIAYGGKAREQQPTFDI